MPVDKLTRHVTTDKDFPSGVSTLPDKEEMIEKINEVIVLLNKLEVDLKILRRDHDALRYEHDRCPWC